MTIFSENKGIILWNFVTLAYSQRKLFTSVFRREKILAKIVHTIHY